MKIEMTLEELEKIIGAGGLRLEAPDLRVPPIRKYNRDKPTTTDKFDPTPEIKSRDC